MYKVTITDPSGAFIEKSPVCGEQQAIELWDVWHEKYSGQNATMKLLRRSTVVVFHRLDSDVDAKNAAQEYFATKSPVGRPQSVDPCVKLFVQLPQSVLATVDARAAERGLTRPQYLRSFITSGHAE